MNKIFKVGYEVFIKKNNLILLGKRKNCYGEGTWDLPGGHLEYDKSLIDYAKQELLKEVGIHRTNLKLITITENVSEFKHYIHASF